MTDETKRLKDAAEMFRAEWRSAEAAVEAAEAVADTAFQRYHEADRVFWDAFNKEPVTSAGAAAAYLGGVKL